MVTYTMKLRSPALPILSTSYSAQLFGIFQDSYQQDAQDPTLQCKEAATVIRE
jgi:hypothetical protein